MVQLEEALPEGQGGTKKVRGPTMRQAGLQQANMLAEQV